jgi:hypothetical protein
VTTRAGAPYGSDSRRATQEPVRVRDVDGRAELELAIAALPAALERWKLELQRSQELAALRAIRATVPRIWMQWGYLDISQVTTGLFNIPAGVRLAAIYVEDALIAQPLSIYLNGFREGTQPAYITFQPQAGGSFRRITVNPEDEVQSVLFSVPALIANPPRAFRFMLSSVPWPPKSGPQ